METSDEVIRYLMDALGRETRQKERTAFLLALHRLARRAQQEVVEKLASDLETIQKAMSEDYRGRDR